MINVAHAIMDWHVILRELESRDLHEQKNARVFAAFKHLCEMRQDGVADKSSGEGGDTELERLTSQLNEIALAKEQADATALRLTKEKKHLQDKLIQLTRRVEGLTMEIKEKNKSIEIINDEHLVNQMQTNVMTERMDQLTKENAKLRAENDELVLRWMKKVAEDAERMNEVNELIGGRR